MGYGSTGRIVILGWYSVVGPAVAVPAAFGRTKRRGYPQSEAWANVPQVTPGLMREVLTRARAGGEYLGST